MRPYLWIPAAGLALMSAISWARQDAASEGPAKRLAKTREKGSRELPDSLHEETRRVEPERAEVPPAAEEGPERTSVTPPEEVQNDPLLLRSWLLGLSNEELAQVVGTERLSAWVSGVIADFTSRRETLDESVPDVNEFLSKLNLRILAVQGLSGDGR